jgi:hypothetical protein
VSAFRALLAGAFALAISFAACAQGATPIECAAGKESCGAICVDLKSDVENCGACGTACTGTQSCVAGKCATQCPGGGLLCSGACVNGKFDNANCGACGKTCKPGEVCSQGSCGTTCQGVTLCAGEGGVQGYCADTKSDNKNCGKCGVACGATESCLNGSCAGSCDMTQTLCAPDGGKAYCANLDTDNDNCGACGKKCGLLESCTAGACVPGCAPFQKLCVPDGGKPYCADTLSDNANCGTCGKVCSGNTPVCSGGACSSGGSSPATCIEMVAQPTIWGRACTGFDLRKRTKSTLHFIGCIDNESCTFYCTYDPQNQTLSFGTKGGAALRAQVDPGDAIGNNFGGSYACCGVNNKNDICNAPDSANNGVAVNGIKALCNALGYQNGTYVRQSSSNSCPQAHSADTTGTNWTSDWQSSPAGYGAEYQCSGFM